MRDAQTIMITIGDCKKDWVILFFNGYRTAMEQAKEHIAKNKDKKMEVYEFNRRLFGKAWIHLETIEKEQ